MKATYHRHILHFKNPSGTSRGILTHKETWFLVLDDKGKKGIGECGLLRGLSIDDRPDYEEKLKWTCQNIALGFETLWHELMAFPSIQMGLETAFISVQKENPMMVFESDFYRGQESMPINGLVWMGSAEYMKQQIEDKIKQGFSCIKLKIGALDFDLELSLIAYIRQFFDEHQMMIRVDANGAFNYIEALDKITQLSEYKLHSIEQPIAKGYPDKMAILCKNTPLPIALDEELIGVYDLKQKQDLLDEIKPQFIILKPSLVGGFKGSQEWIRLAEARNIGWWVTSALESNIGLNAIAQWTYTLNSSMYQGLGTGGLYTNNFDSPLTISEGKIYYDENKPWSLPDFIK